MWVECLVLDSSHWFLLFMLISCVTWWLNKDLLSDLCWLPSFLKILSAFPTVLFPCRPSCSVLGVDPLEFRMGQQWAKETLPTDAWWMTAGMCRMCSTSVTLVAVGRTGAMLSPWGVQVGEANGPYWAMLVVRTTSSVRRIPLLDLC